MEEEIVRDKKPNLLLLMTDQHRGDCLGCDGHPAIKTPHLDRLANEGIRFSSAYSSTPTCTPARSALLTGRSPWHHGMLGYGRVANRYDCKLPQALRDLGYHTFGVGKMHWFPQKTLNGFYATLVDESGRRETKGFVSDYHRWFQKQAPDLDPQSTGIGWNDHRSRVYAHPEELHPTHWTAQTAIDFIREQDRERPFFLKVSFARPHSPYDPPQRFMNMYMDEDIPSPSLGDWSQVHAQKDTPFTDDLWHGDLGAAQVSASRRGYYGSISFIDDQIGRILDALSERDLLENTFILFLGDHGDMTGDHHLWRKSYGYEGSARIPFLVRWPEGMGLNVQRGRTCTEPVEIRDVLPTFLDVGGGDIPSSVDGKSVLPFIEAQSPSWREYIDLEHDVCYSPLNHWNALTDGKMKYIYHAHNGKEQLFNLVEDPGETRDLAEEPRMSRELQSWRTRLIEHLSERGERFVRDGQLVKRPKRMLYSPHYPGADKA